MFEVIMSVKIGVLLTTSTPLSSSVDRFRTKGLTKETFEISYPPLLSADEGRINSALDNLQLSGVFSLPDPLFM